MKPKSNDKALPAQSGEGSDLGTSVTLPFTRQVNVEHLPDGGLDVSIVATSQECVALAKLNGLVAIDRFEAAFHLIQRLGMRLNVSGEVRASITQTCVVSLEPFETSVSEAVDVDFMPAEAVAKWQAESDAARERNTISEEEIDAPDEIVDGKIDLGALASEFLVLALDPYPKKPGAHFEEFSDELDGKTSPFAILQKLNKS